MSASEFHRNSLMERALNTSTILRAEDVLEMVFPGPAPRVVPGDPDDDPVVHTAVVGRADALCTLTRDFFHSLVRDYCRERGVLIASDVELLSMARSQKQS